MLQHSILIVGCGGIGERHLRCFMQSNRSKRIVACDANPATLERIAASYGVQTARSWRDVLNEGSVDAAVICTPAPLHVPLGIECLKAGIHVLIEKPLSVTMQDVDRLIATQIESGRQVSVAYVYHVIPALAAAREYLRKGALGRVMHATVRAGQPFHLIRPDYTRNYYRDRKSGGGAIQDALTHLANWVESVLGPTDSVLCDCAHLALANVTVEDTVHVTARHGSAMVGYFLNQFQAPNETTIQFDTAKGSLMVELHRQRWGIFRYGDTQWTWHDVPVPDRDAHFIAQANAFLDQIEGRGRPLCSLEAAAQTIRFNLAALASAESGTRVHCASLHV